MRLWAIVCARHTNRASMRGDAVAIFRVVSLLLEASFKLCTHLLQVHDSSSAFDTCD